MIEFSFAELFLLVWAFVATVVAVSKTQSDRSARAFIEALLSDDDMRNEVVSAYKAFKEAKQ